MRPDQNGPGAPASAAEVYEASRVKPLRRTEIEEPEIGNVDGFPITIDAWPSGRREEVVRVTLDRFEGVYTIEIRCWWRDEQGALKPGRAGIKLGVRHLRKLAHNLAAALRRAEDWGLVDPAAEAGTRPERETPEVTARPRRRQRMRGVFNG